MENVMNVMTEELNTFIDKAQRIAMDLYNEYNSFENAVEYACPLTDMIDQLYAFSLMEKKETIK